MSHPDLGPVVIVGGGVAAAECAARLRMADYPGSVTVLSADSHPPYELPALSKAYLSGACGYEDVLVRPLQAYPEHGIDLQLNTRVAGFDPAAHEVRLADGRVVPYAKLVLATGGTPRLLPVPGAAESAHVHYLRTMGDADRLKDAVRPDSQIAVIGGGYLGLEVASAMRGLGAQVTVLEGLPRLLARVTSPPVSDYFAKLHRDAGVDVRLQSRVGRIVDTADGRVEVHLAGGAALTADVVFVSVGLVPSVQLAIDAGLDTQDGIRVDERGRTSAVDVFAAGDCTSHPDPDRGGFRRLESQPNALEMAAAVAAAILGESGAPAGVPWFWSEQYDVKLQTIGLYQEGDEAVIRGDASGGPLSVIYLRDGVVRAADVISNPREFAAAKTLVHRRVAATAAQLANRDVPLKSLLTAAGATARGVLNPTP